MTTKEGHGERTGLGDGVLLPTFSFRTWQVGLVFLVMVPTIAHLLFSWMGLNPTDDGSIFVVS